MKQKKQILSFYETAYLKNNPNLDVVDCEWKYNQLFEMLNFESNIKIVIELGCGSGVLLSKIRDYLKLNLSRYFIVISEC